MKKLLLVVVLFGLLVPFAFAASLDDPVPQTPTIRTELQSGYRFAESLYNGNRMYDTYSLFKIMQSESIIIERDKSPAYQLGFYFGFRYLLFKNRTNDRDLLLVNGNTYLKIQPLLSQLDLDIKTVAECFGINWEEYKKTYNDNMPL